jgi:hypothetical protein
MATQFSVARLVIAVTLSLLLFVPLVLWLSDISFSRLPPPMPTAAAPTPPPPAIAQIQLLSDLAITKIHISDFIEGEDAHFAGKWSLHGDVVLGVELGKAVYQSTDEVTRKATLGLPCPHIVLCKVDHERSEELFMHRKVPWPLGDPKLLRDDTWKEAARKLERLALEPGYNESAKVQAERVLEKLFKGVGWQLACVWR